MFEIVGGGFEKPTNCSFYIPRHPRVCKIHWDRSYLETMSFLELQEAAGEALNVGGEDYEDMQTESQWIERLLEKDLSAKELKKRNLENEAAAGAAKKRKKPEVSPKPATIKATSLLSSPPGNRPATGLRDIPQPPNTPGRRSLQGNSTTSSGLSEPRMSSPECTSNPPSSSERDHCAFPPIRKSCLTSPTGPTATKIFGKIYSERQQQRGRVPLQTPASVLAGAESLQLKNGHSSTSPLHRATVFLPHYLMKFPKLIERITNHDAEIIHLLPTAVENIVSLMPTSKKAVVLVESSKSALTKKTLKNLCDMSKTINKGVKEGQGYRWETYDWRIVNHHQLGGGWETDWSLWHVWSVV